MTPSPLPRGGDSVAWFEIPCKKEAASHAIGDEIHEESVRVPCTQRLYISDDDEPASSSGEGHVQSAGILSETNTPAVIGTCHREDDEIFLAALVSIHAGYLHSPAQDSG